MRTNSFQLMAGTSGKERADGTVRENSVEQQQLQGQTPLQNHVEEFGANPATNSECLH